MSEAKLEWAIREWDRDEKPVHVSKCGGLHLIVDASDSFYWRVGHVTHGKATTLLAAQLAAEAAALAWLSEGVVALGGRALTSEQMELVMESLWSHGVNYSDRASELARELEAGDDS